MRYILIIILLITYNTLSQNKDSADLMDSLYNHIITKNGCSIDFEYWFENENYKMEKPITGNIVFFSQDRFFLEFNSRNQKRIQIFDGEKFMTILNQEKEIQIENLSVEDDILIKDIFTNYKTKFNHYIKSDNSQNTIIELTSIDEYHMIYNSCIDELTLPSCLKLPKQCRIGIGVDDQKKLEECITRNDKRISKRIYIEIDNIKNQLGSIIILDGEGGETSILIKKINKKREHILKIDSLINIGFEVIDLR